MKLLIISRIICVLAIVLILVSTLMRSSFNSTPLSEVLDWPWWVTFFTFSVWLDLQAKGISNSLDRVKKELKSKAE